VVKPLPGTLGEIRDADSMLADGGYELNVFTGKNASERMLKRAFDVEILHIATHGYFLEDIDQFGQRRTIFGIETERAIENPLLRSGLLLAGAEYGLEAINAERQKNYENGVLTAYEAANLELEGTRLVVLSACETGLGEIRNGEGVYGLQRAFRNAGADVIIMSLWKVDDNSARELISEFYRNYMAGSTLQEAFAAAREKVRRSKPQPYYWGAFVMVGL
jgi:CHAT domain-containing protein